MVSATIRAQELSDEADAAKERAEGSERELRAVAEFREMFIGILGHDLRNPLASIVMAAARLLRSGHLHEHDAETAARIIRGSQRMHQMITQLLDLTRARLGGGLPIEPKPTDLARFVPKRRRGIRGAHPTGGRRRRDRHLGPGSLGGSSLQSRRERHRVRRARNGRARQGARRRSARLSSRFRTREIPSPRTCFRSSSSPSAERSSTRSRQPEISALASTSPTRSCSRTAARSTRTPPTARRPS